MDDIPTPLEALEEAVRRAGSQAEFARILGVSQPAVWKMLQALKRLPIAHVLTVERELDVPRYYLRPDIYPLPSEPRNRLPLSKAVPPRIPARPRGKRQAVAA